MKHVLHVPRTFLAALKIIQNERFRRNNDKLEAAQSFFATLKKYEKGNPEFAECDKKTFCAYQRLVAVTLDLWRLEFASVAPDTIDTAKELRLQFHQAAAAVTALGKEHHALADSVIDWWWNSPLFAEAQASS